MSIIDSSGNSPLLNLDLFAKQVVEGFITGLHRSPFHGFSVEFAEHRAYNQGESTRHIDWKLYGKTDKLFTKRYEEETNLRAQIILDVSGSMYFPESDNQDIEKLNKIGFSGYSAAVLINLLKRQRDAFALHFISDKLEFSTAAKSNIRHQQLLFASLEKAILSKPSNKDTQLIPQLHLLAEKFPKRSLILLFTDFFDRNENLEDLFEALQHLRHQKHEVIIFHTYHGALEKDLKLENRPYKLIDQESGEVLKLNPENIKAVYQEKMVTFFKDLRLRCGQYGIEFVEADIEKGFDQILTPFLVKRKRLF